MSSKTSTKNKAEPGSVRRGPGSVREGQSRVGCTCPSCTVAGAGQARERQIQAGGQVMPCTAAVLFGIVGFCPDDGQGKSVNSDSHHVKSTCTHTHTHTPLSHTPRERKPPPPSPSPTLPSRDGWVVATGRMRVQVRHASWHARPAACGLPRTHTHTRTQPHACSPPFMCAWRGRHNAGEV
jgi:hypothetical protein